MNVKEFYSYIKNPSLLNEQTLHELSEVIERYPYFQAAHMLYLKNLSLLHDDRYQSTLTTTSLYAPDRKTLFNLIHDKEQKTTETANEFLNTIVEEKAENTASEVTVKTIAPTQEIKTEENKIETIDEEIKKVPFEKVEQQKEIKADTIKEAAIKEKNVEITNQPIETTEQKKTIAPPTASTFEIPQEPIISKEQTHSLADQILQRINEIKKKNEAKEIKQEIIISQQTPTTSSAKEPVNQSSESSMTFDEWLYHLSENKENPVQEKKENLSNSLIDNFLNHASNISKIKADPNNIQNDLTENMTQPEESEIITESLAQLYNKQGYFEKSLIMYQKLILKYPEKSIYFASLIEELKNKLDKS